ncbi:MAG: sulfotransferase, partial [Chloroflexota bacterium]|nr:sulfotransferase [Chloroflexota bacterium]
MERGPIFIGGTGRSGKTWMRFMLSSHPNICLSRRANLWTDHDGRYGDLARVANLERCLDTLLRSKHIQFLNPDADRIRREFRHGPATYARLFALLHEHYAEQQGKPRWGDQTEMIE